MIEGGVVSFVRADHIGRPVFATNASGVKVWSAVYTPFGGVHTSTGSLPNARFPGQWFQAESGLHQNWMRDYDPTTGRYLQPDPLGLLDGANVYGYVQQNPGRWMDPKGEFGVLGALVGGLSNFGLQLFTNTLIYGDLKTAFRCVDFKSVVISSLFGAGGVSPLIAFRTGGFGSAAATQGLISYAKLEAGFYKLRIAGDCECKVSNDKIEMLRDFLDTFQL